MLRKVVAVVRWFNQTPCRPKRGRFFTSLQLLSPVSLFESLPFQIILPFQPSKTPNHKHISSILFPDYPIKMLPLCHFLRVVQIIILILLRKNRNQDLTIKFIAFISKIYSINILIKIISFIHNSCSIIMLKRKTFDSQINLQYNLFYIVKGFIMDKRYLNLQKYRIRYG